MSNDDADLFDKIYDATCEYVDRNKNMIGMVCFILLACWFGECCLGLNKIKCKESIIDMNSIIRDCNNGAKLKHVNDQWVCNCEE